MKSKSTVTTANPSQNAITTLVERGFAIHQQLLVLNEEFKNIKDRLKMEAVARPGEHIPLLDQDSLGDQWVVRRKDCECRIVFPAPQISTELDPSQPAFLSVKALAGNHFNALFRKITFFQAREKKAFRAQVSNLLKPEEATKLLDLCSSPSEPKAMWKALPTGKATK